MSTGRGPNRPNLPSLSTNALDYLVDGVDVTTGLQHAIDNTLPGGTLYIPAGKDPYYVTRPLRRWRFLQIRGDGPGCTSLRPTGGTHGVFLFGVDPWKPGESYRPLARDCYDGSVGGNPRGLATQANSYYQWEACPPMTGPVGGWQTKLTLDLYLGTTDGAPILPERVICGFGQEERANLAPVLLKTWQQPNRILVLFRTSEQEHGLRFFYFDLTGPPPWKVAVQIDLDAATVGAFIRNARVPAILPRGPLPTGLRFAPNDHNPLAWGDGPFTPGRGANLVCYGMRWSNTVRYSGDVITDNDRTRFFGDDSHTVAYLPLADDPDDDLVAVQPGGATLGGGRSLGIHFNWARQGGGSIAVRDLDLVGTAYGQGIGIAGTLDYKIERVNISGFWQCVATTHSLTYPVRIRDCHLAGVDSAMCFFMSLVSAQDIDFDLSGTVTVRLQGCSFDLKRANVGRESPGAAGFLKANANDYGGNICIDTVMLDFEGAGMVKGGALFDIERQGVVGSTSLTVREIDVAGLNGGPVFRLRDGWGTDAVIPPGTMDADRITVWGDCVVAALDGPSWRGNVRRLFAMKPGTGSPRITHSQKWGDQCGVAVHEDVDSLPTEGEWYRGGHVLHVLPEQADYHCTRSGEYPGKSASPTTAPEWTCVTAMAK